jgi:transcriptional regulator with XRE-family HTH domain
LVDVKHFFCVAYYMPVLNIKEIHKWVKAAGIRQHEIADAFGLTDRSTVSRQFSGQSQLSAEQLLALINLVQQRLPAKDFAAFLRNALGFSWVVSNNRESNDEVLSLYRQVSRLSAELSDVREQLSEQPTHHLPRRHTDPPRFDATKLRQK